MEGFSTLHQMALDTLSIPAMATECERVFSSAKKLVSPHRCCIKEDLVEASVPESVVGLWDYYAELGRERAVVSFFILVWYPFNIHVLAPGTLHINIS
jgi:hypothetical protein